MKIRKQLAFLLIIAAILPLVIISGTFIALGYMYLRDSVFEQLASNAERKATIAERNINTIKETALVYSRVFAVRKALNEYDKTSTITQESMNPIQILFESTTDIKPSYVLITLNDKEGNLLFSSSNEETKNDLPISADLMKKSREHGFCFSEIISNSSFYNGKTVHICVVPVKDNDTVIGYITFFLSMQEFIKAIVLTDEDYDEANKFTVIYDNNNSFVNTVNPQRRHNLSQVGVMNDFAEEWAKVNFPANPKGVFTFMNLRTKTKRIAYYSVIPSTGWKVVETENYNTIVFPIYRIAVILFGFMVIVAGLFLYVATRSAGYFVRKMHKVISQIEDSKSKGLMSPISVVTRTDEIDLMINAFNTLIDALQEKNTQLLKRAKYDPMTKLYSRTFFEPAVRELINKFEAGKSPSKSYLVFLFIDIDDFKNFNSQYGHAFGDRIIRFIGEILLDAIYGHGYGCRFGGDEFVLCISDQNVITNLDTFIGNLTKRLSSELIVREGETLQIKCSIGLTRFPENGTSYEILIEKADQAMYSIKISGKNGVKEFDN
ncbi:MAG: sensor domain-containing diguanylate cyclase [Candidatus Sumerlaeales bacterium]|nr:sensor domain-containing diguanylate cyclase [Candidatus Sumerlaeales bacterium]